MTGTASQHTATRSTSRSEYSTMVVIHGDLLNAQADAICQQVNCRNVMGAGLAKAIYTRWPAVKRLYHNYCISVGNPYALLGTVQVIKKQGDIPFDVVNIFGQLNYGRENICYTNYEALSSAFKKINREYYGKTVGFPYMFACGLAGGDWAVVQKLMQEYLRNVRVGIYRKGE